VVTFLAIFVQGYFPADIGWFIWTYLHPPPVALD